MKNHAILMSLIALAGCQQTQKPASPTEPAAKAPTVHFLGEAFPASDGLVLTVVSGNVGDNNSLTLPGAVYVAVDLKIDNKGAKPLLAAKAPAIHLVDGSGTKYAPDAGLSAAYQMQLPVSRKTVSDLNPGLAETDSAVFEVSKAQFKTSSWWIEYGGQKILFCNKANASNGACVEGMPQAK